MTENEKKALLNIACAAKTLLKTQQNIAGDAAVLLSGFIKDYENMLGGALSVYDAPIPKVDSEMASNLMAAGALQAALSLLPAELGLLTSKPVIKDDHATNAIDVIFHFLRSPYRLTVERVAEVTEIESSNNG